MERKYLFVPLFFRYISRNNRLSRLRLTAEPTVLVATKATFRWKVASRLKTMVTCSPWSRVPFWRTSPNSFLPLSLSLRGRVCRDICRVPQTVSLLLPLALLRLRIARPPLVLIRLRNPCLLRRFRQLGWKVRFIHNPLCLRNKYR